MRNLKRALSLTLASVMLLGMMVVGASAKGYPDVDDNDNVEAIEVLQAVQVMRGDENGNFDPDRNVTRVEMAVVMALLLNLDYQYYEATCPFTDVPTWARGYVGACYANGVTSGYSANTYGSNDGITPVQAASMMMRALGYFKYAEDYNDGFEVVTVRQGTQIGIFEGVGSSATASMTRNQVARMALNALRSEMVTFTGTPGMEVNGVNVGYRAEYTPRTSTEVKFNAIEGRTGKGVLTEVYVDTSSVNPTVYISIINTYVAKAREDYNTKDEEIDLTVYGVDFVANSTALVKDTTNRGTPFTEVLTPAGEDFELLKDAKKDDLFLVHVADGDIQEIIVPEILSAVNLTGFSKTNYVISDGTQYDYANTALYNPGDLDEYTSVNGNINLKDMTYNVILDEYGYLIGIEQIEDPTQYVFITGTEGGYSDMYNTTITMRAIFTDGTTDVIEVDMSKSTGVNAFRNMGPIINTWCTYTVNNKDIYTLKAVPLSIGGGKIAQWAQNAYHTANNGSADGIRGTSSYTIDKGHTTLVANNGTTDIRVYGNDKTIYINAEMSVIEAKTQLGGTVDASNSLTSAGNGLTDGIGGTTDKNYVVGDTTSGNPRTAIISDVDSVTVGIANTNIKAVSLAEADLERSLENGDRNNTTANDLVFPKSEIYTLYNDKGVVIAAVVLGDDQGTGTKLALFPNSEPSEERLVGTDARTSDEIWEWTRKAIIDGEEVTLTERGDNLSQLSAANIGMGDLVEIRFDADNRVRRADNLTKFNGANMGSGNVFSGGIGKYTTDITNVEKSAEANETVVLYENFTNGAHSLVYDNGTLFRDNANTKGVYVQNAPVIVATAKLKDNVNGTPGKLSDVNQYENISRTFTGENAMSDALNALDKNFTGYLIIIVKDHVASSVILNDTYGKKVNTGNTNKGDLDDLTKVFRAGSTFTVEYYDKNYGTDKAMTAEQVRDLCAAAVSDYFNGITVKPGTWSSLSNSGQMYLDDGSILGETITVNSARMQAFFVDGELNGYKRATSGSVTLGTPGTGTDTTSAITGEFLIGKNAKASSSDSTNGTVTVSSTDGDVYLTTAYAVTLNDAVTATYTELANATSGNAGGNIATGTKYYIAKDTVLNLELTGKNDSKTYQFQADTPVDPTLIGESAVLAANTDKLEATYKVTSADDTTISVTSGVVVKVKYGAETKSMVVADIDDVTFDDLADLAGLGRNEEGGYLVDLDAAPDGTGGEGVTTTTMSNKVNTAKAGFLVAGNTYEFGYYKVTMPADITDLSDDDSLFTNGDIAWAVTGVTTPADGEVYYLKDGGTVVATVTADSATAGMANATVAGGTGAVAKVVNAEVDESVDATATMTAEDETVTIDNNRAKFNNVELTFTWTVNGDDIAAANLTVTASNS